MKRDHIDEILSKRGRTTYNERDEILQYRIHALDAVVEHCSNYVDRHGLYSESNIEEKDNELHRYIPIGMIACVESFFRAAIKELIDFGRPFSDNAASLREIKFDFSTVQAIAGKRVSLGDFLSHLLPLKNVESINSTMGAIMGQDLLESLKSHFFRRDDFEEGQPRFLSAEELSKEQQKEISFVYSGVKDCFYLRNVFCHEVASSNITDVASIYKSYEATKRFLDVSNTFLWFLVEPDYPLGTYGLQHKLGLELERLDVEINEKLGQLIEAGHKMEVEIQKIWEVYRDKRMEAVSRDWEGGTGQMSASLMEAIDVTKLRLEELGQDFRNKIIR